MSTTPTQRKVLAVLAGGLVLGIGTAVTLAAWNDSEFANGTFAAGSFNLEGSTAGDVDANYADHATAPGADLEFTLPLAGNLSPDAVVYASFWVRLDDTTTSDATVIPASIAAGTGGNEANLSYSIRAIGPAATCDGTGGTVVATGADLSTLTSPTAVALSKGATAGTAGTAVQLCFAVTAASTLAEGLPASVTWEFEATSTN